MNIKMLYLIFGLGLAACVSNAALIDDDFSSYTVGSSMDGLGGWTVVNSSGTTAESGNQVVIVSDAEASPFGTSSNSMYYYDTSDLTSVMWVSHSFTTVSTSLNISFDYYMNYNASQNPVFKLYDDVGDIAVYINLQSTSDEMRYRDSSGWQTVCAIANKTWYNVEITITDVSSGTFDLVVTQAGGTIVASLTDLSFFTTVESVSGIAFGVSNGSQAKSTIYYVGDVEVIPEPASVSMIMILCVGGLALLRRRKAK